MDKGEILGQVREIISEALGFDSSEFEDTDNFFEIGLDSVSAATVAVELRTKVSSDLDFVGSDLYKTPSVETLTASIHEKLGATQ